MAELFVEKMDDFIKKHYEENKNSGCLRITKNDEIIYERSIGYADIENKIEFAKNSVFTYYSLTKPFSAIGLLKLKDKNLVDIDAHPSEYVLEAMGFDKNLTVRQMLHHISGLPDFVQTAKFQERYRTGLSWQMREHLKELADYPMVFSPGTEGMYANVNFIVIALIIENVSGMKYPDYMKKEVFEPLGMVTAKIDEENTSVAGRVKGYEVYDGRIQPVDRDQNWMFGAGDIIGTVDDVYCLNKAIKHKLLLKPETWEEVLTPSELNCMGMGCCVTDWHGKKRITHNGGSRGFRTLHIQLPDDDFDIIYLSNSGWGDARNDYAEAIYNAYYGEDSSVGKRVVMDNGYI